MIGLSSDGVDFDHLVHMTDGRGTFEHARYAEPRPEHGYCTDDMARVLLVAVRQPRPGPDVVHLGELALRFLGQAQAPDGAFRNRMAHDGTWEDQPTLEDCWGRSVWALGTAAARSGDPVVRLEAEAGFARAARARSPWPRARAFAALGAAEVLAARPGHAPARALMVSVADLMVRPDLSLAWPWPEPSLTYANAVIPDAMVAAGAALGRTGLLRSGLSLLAWLLAHESRDGHLSVTPAGGDGAGAVRPAFDQQPIEVAALAEACARASALDDDPRWAAGLAAAAAWFDGDNDAGLPMWDPVTGGGFDGLGHAWVNRNQGCESTLALLATRQHARRPVTSTSPG